MPRYYHEFQTWRPLAEENREAIEDLQAFSRLILNDAGVEYDPVDFEDLRLTYLSGYATQMAAKHSARFAMLRAEGRLPYEIGHDAPRSFHTPYFAHVESVNLPENPAGAHLSLLMQGQALQRDRRYMAKKYTELSGTGAEALPQEPLVILGRTHGAPEDVDEITKRISRMAPSRVLFNKTRFGRLRSRQH